MSLAQRARIVQPDRMLRDSRFAGRGGAPQREHRHVIVQVEPLAAGCARGHLPAPGIERLHPGFDEAHTAPGEQRRRAEHRRLPAGQHLVQADALDEVRLAIQ